MFVDSVVVRIKAGDGGSGIVSFRHERAVTRGGPDGGDGGNGGDIILTASNNENTLANFRYQKELIADDGKNGASSNMHGRSGENLLVNIPVGTEVLIDGEVVADLAENGQQIVIARGGKGGFGNAHFTSSVRQAPKFAEKGEPGEDLEVEFELKIIADVGLVGLPNAGKSTLLASVSAAKPKIANYPFTTLNPHLGVVKIADNQELLLADIPGLIEGASEGKGLGDEFLRHVERTGVLLHMIDSYSNDVVESYNIIQNELKNYKINLSKKPQLIALTKIEGLDDEIVEDQVQSLKKVTDTPIFPISALSRDGLRPLLFALYALVTEERKKALSAQPESTLPVIGVTRDDDSWKVVVRDGKVVVTGRKIERFAMRTDFESEDGVRRLRDIMRKMGIMRNLKKQELPENARVYFGRNKDDYLELH